MTRTAAVYVRISKDRADEISTDIQRARCHQHIEDQGWTVGGEYADIGRSAYKKTSSRPELDRMLEDVKTGIVDAVIVYRLDRLARSVRDFANIHDVLESAGCQFVSISDNLDTTTAMGRAMMQMASVMAELESGIKSERITDWHAQRRASGKFPTGPKPFGYTPQHEIEPGEAALIREAAGEILAGRSLNSICKEWDANGVPTSQASRRRSAASKWNARTLRTILKNPTTAGLRDVDGVLVDGGWEPVLDRDTWDSLRQLFADPSRRSASPGFTRRWLLTGIVECGRCGTPMSVKGNANGPRYSCLDRSGWDACTAVSMKAGSVNEFVIELAKTALTGATAPTPASPSAAVVEALEDELAALASDYGEGRITRAEWHTAADGLRSRLESSIAAPAPPAGVDLTDLDRLDVDQQRAVLRWLFASIRINPAKPSGANRFDPDRIAFDWRV